MKSSSPSVVLLAAAFVAAAASSAQAQVTFGPRIGLNVANVSQDFEDADDEFDTKALIGPQIGLSLNAQFGNLSIQPSLLYSQVGYKIDRTESGVTLKGSERLNYVQVPVNFVYTTGGTEGFQVFAGPYVGIGLGGKYEFDVSGGGFSGKNEGDIKFADKYGTDKDTDYRRTLDFGLNGGVGYKTGPIQAQLGYGLGLSNLEPNDKDDKEPEDKLKNSVLHLSIAYFFGE